MNRRKKILVLLVSFALLLSLPSCGAGAARKPTVGVAWRSDREAESFQAVCKAIEIAGGTPVVLDQVLSADLTYENGLLTDGKEPDGSLAASAAKLVRCNRWQGSNAAAVMDGITAIVFPGGEDISPTLYYDAQLPETDEGFSAERDVSDYLLMSYCMDNDIAILAICRGMQMLSVVSGAEMMQDIPDYMESLGLAYRYEHRNEPPSPGAYRDFAFHDVTVTDENSLLCRIIGETVVRDAPSWHHQAVKSVAGTRLVVTGTAQISGVDMIEAVERPDKAFALGIQWHPEIAVVRELDDTSVRFFTAILDAAK